VNAECANDPEMIRSSHHGLMNLCITSGDLDAALVHGWNVLRLSLAPESRGEALMNMGEICRLSGEHNAAMRAFSVAIEWTSNPRIQFHALSSAACCAIKLRKIADARDYLAAADLLVADVADVFTIADVGLEVADSLYQLGDKAAAQARLNVSMAIARENEFHEIIHLAERVQARWNQMRAVACKPPKEARRRRFARSDVFRMVIRSLNALGESTT
jgi:tetratricopeptide (TPR) repeat protein